MGASKVTVSGPEYSAGAILSSGCHIPAGGDRLLSSVDPENEIPEDPSVQPMDRFSAPRMVRKESVVKKEIDVYHVSEVDNTAVIYMGRRALSIYQTLDLPDASCDGLIFKQRLVQSGPRQCLLLARWKPDRRLRRTAPTWSQKWFVEKRLYPPDVERFFSRIEKKVADASDIEEAGQSEEQTA